MRCNARSVLTALIWLLGLVVAATAMAGQLCIVSFK